MQVKTALLGCALAVFAPTVLAENLLQIYQAAEQQDPVFAAAQATHKASQEKLPQGRAGLLPNVSVAANTIYNEVDIQYRGATTLPSGERRYNSNGYTVTLSQPLFRLQNFAQYAQAKEQVAAGDAQFQDARQNLILRVAQVYFDYLLAQDSLQLAQAQKKAIAEQLEIAKKSFELGTTTITDTHEAQAKYDLTSAQEIAAQKDLEVQRQLLANLIGSMPTELQPLNETMQARPVDPANPDEWLKQAVQGNPQLLAQQANLAAAREEVRKNRAGHLPTLDLVASYSDSGAGGSTFGVGNDTKAQAVGLQLNIPLFAGGGVQSRVREALANEERAQADLENTRRLTELGVRQSYLETNSAMLRVRALEQALLSAQSALDSNKLGFEVGVRTSVDVLNTMQQYFTAKRDLQSARYQWILSGLKLQAAAGQLGVADVERVNALLVRSVNPLPAAAGSAGKAAAVATPEKPLADVAPARQPETAASSLKATPAVTAAPAAKPASKPAGGKQIMLQLGAFSEAAPAEKLEQRLRVALADFSMPVLHEQEGGLYKVRIGPYADKKAAWKMAKQIRAELGISPIIIRR